MLQRKQLTNLTTAKSNEIGKNKHITTKFIKLKLLF